MTPKSRALTRPCDAVCRLGPATRHRFFSYFLNSYSICNDCNEVTGSNIEIKEDVCFGFIGSKKESVSCESFLSFLGVTALHSSKLLFIKDYYPLHARYTPLQAIHTQKRVRA